VTSVFDRWVELQYRLAKAWRNYRNPLSLHLQRFARRRHVRVHDRTTSLVFECQQGADRMLGETFHSKVYDIPEAPVRRGDWVIDAGANHGFAACYFAARGARVVACEPSPQVFDLLVANVRRNGLQELVYPLPCAIGDCDGTARLHVTPVLGGGISSLDASFIERMGVQVLGVVEVPTRSVASIVQELQIPRIRLIKLDCEGSELTILRSLPASLLEVIDSLAIEYHPEAYAVSELLDTILAWTGFHVSKVSTLDITNANLRVVREPVLREWSRQP
jgi:FkbM family methyltransferase